MNLNNLLKIAMVPESLYAEASASVDLSARNNNGLTLAKWKVRLFEINTITSSLKWDTERLVDVRPDLADWDIAPMINIRAYGDCGPWLNTPNGPRPIPGLWLNPDPTSAEYKSAVAANYWLPGTHPRSPESHAAWYRRNAGEYRAWRMGAPIDPTMGLQIWRGASGDTSVIVWRSCGAWLVNASHQLSGSLHWNTRVGFELDNLFSGDDSAQMWYPAPGYELKATVSHSTLPALKGINLTPKKWEIMQPNGNGTYSSWPVAISNA